MDLIYLAQRVNVQCGLSKIFHDSLLSPCIHSQRSRTIIIILYLSSPNYTLGLLVFFFLIVEWIIYWYRGLWWSTPFSIALWWSAGCSWYTLVHHVDSWFLTISFFLGYPMRVLRIGNSASLCCAWVYILQAL